MHTRTNRCFMIYASNFQVCCTYEVAPGSSNSLWRRLAADDRSYDVRTLSVTGPCRSTRAPRDADNVFVLFGRRSMGFRSARAGLEAAFDVARFDNDVVTEQDGYREPMACPLLHRAQADDGQWLVVCVIDLHSRSQTHLRIHRILSRGR
jgi:hypothetical protein